MATTKEILVKARELIVNGWCQEFEAKTADGCGVAYGHLKAVQFCTLGAVYKATPRYEAPHFYNGYKILEEDRKERERALQLLKVNLPPSCSSLIDWNDEPSRRVEDVLAIFDKALEHV